ncbi:MAG: hypothetical protein KJ697_03585 [Nanoarchaeota archaeon]|nr:hypothetical protein [Nanoarchaeota archaeon]
MNKQKALIITTLISLVGVLFSGYMSYTELIGGTCAGGGCSILLGLPTCVYGLVMYIIVFVVSATGVMSKV